MRFCVVATCKRPLSDDELNVLFPDRQPVTLTGDPATTLYTIPFTSLNHFIALSCLAAFDRDCSIPNSIRRSMSRG